MTNGNWKASQNSVLAYPQQVPSAIIVDENVKTKTMLSKICFTTHLKTWHPVIDKWSLLQQKKCIARQCSAIRWKPSTQLTYYKNTNKEATNDTHNEKNA
jgi:hypothetical protein